MKGGNETDVDCGGSCAPCADTKKCLVAADCIDKVCDPNAQTCTAPTCSDAVKNGLETDVDCGGVACDGKGKPCAFSKGCKIAADCLGGICNGTTCVASCTDTVQNGSETDVDCGGPTCSACADGKGCTANGDCAGGICEGGTICCTPASKAVTCSGKCGLVADNCGQQVDCGTAQCVPPQSCGGSGAPNVCGCMATCGDGIVCAPTEACDDGHTTACGACDATCTAPGSGSICGDGVVCPDTEACDDFNAAACGGCNAACTGAGAGGCTDGIGCGASSDCQNANCSANVCIPAPTCVDSLKNGTETDVDCGGSCPTCVDGKVCGGNGDCSSGHCIGNQCVSACVDGVKDGGETDVDCGGAACPTCLGNRLCSVPSDCASGVCSGAPARCVGGPSCAGGLDCGGVSCCDAPLVPGGTFPMGRGNGADAYGSGYMDELPEHNATVADFRLDTFEVTVGRFRKFASQFNGTPPAAGAGANPLIANSGWQPAWNGSLAASQAELVSNLECDPTYQTWTDTAAGGHETLPMNCVSWFDAFAFCAWDGGRIPTDAEWEYAAAGGTDNRRFPWGGSAPDHTRASFDCAFNGAPGSCAFADIAPVGSLPAGNGKWGHSDLAGNLFEWSLDRYDAAWYSGGGAVCNNCANLGSGSLRTLRSQPFWDAGGDLRSVTRGYYTPGAHFYIIGFRCARTP